MKKYLRGNSSEVGVAEIYNVVGEQIERNLEVTM